VSFDGGTAALLVTAGAVTLVVVVFGLLILRRTGRAMSATVDEIETRIGTAVHELKDALTRSEEERRRARVLEELATSLELDDVLDRVVRVSREVARADAAVVRLVEPAGEDPVVAAVGVELEEAGSQLELGAPPDGRVARATSIQYRYADADAEGTALLHALVVPVSNDGELVGRLAVYSRHPAGSFSEETLAELEQLAGRAAPAIANARRFREARLLADMDALTGLHNQRYFHEELAREVLRAHRYGRALSLIVLDADAFKAVNDRIGHLSGDAVLAEAARRIGAVVRSVDVPCRVGGDEFAVILPESSLLDAERLGQRIQDAVSAEPIGQVGIVRFSAGIAELEQNEDAQAFFERADRQLYRAKTAAPGDPFGETTFGAPSSGRF
jgi:diguanylate cyclase (GGDEF)-like protein